jgi:hypothetical protein
MPSLLEEPEDDTNIHDIPSTSPDLTSSPNASYHLAVQNEQLFVKRCPRDFITDYLLMLRIKCAILVKSFIIISYSEYLIFIFFYIVEFRCVSKLKKNVD